VTWKRTSPSVQSSGRASYYLDGTSIPAAKDPRASMAEQRYKDRDIYLIKVRENAEALAKDGYVLPEDIDRTVARADRNAKFENGAQ
jgi:alpha/beta hydrolase family protein